MGYAARFDQIAAEYGSRLDGDFEGVPVARTAAPSLQIRNLVEEVIVFRHLNVYHASSALPAILFIVELSR